MKTNFTAAPKTYQHAALGFRIHLVAFLIATPVIWLVWYLTDTTYPWPLWSTPAWALGVLFHYLGVFVFNKKQSNTF
ncbi:2TM domain-containing protein [Flavobacterium sp.]|uniref:2TM domain-containing protein n=1 Tax=Flavobacterium sp. TaxID=239 RepID=UPI0039E2EBE5